MLFVCRCGRKTRVPRRGYGVDLPLVEDHARERRRETGIEIESLGEVVAAELQRDAGFVFAQRFGAANDVVDRALFQRCVAVHPETRSPSPRAHHPVVLFW